MITSTHENARGGHRLCCRHDRMWAVVAIVGAGILFSSVSIIQLRSGGSGLDSAIWANVLWRLAHGFDDVSALTGVHHFGDHPSILPLLAIPVFRWSSSTGLPFLLVLQSGSLALVGLGGWLIAEEFRLARRACWGVLAVTLAGAGMWMAALSDFHATTLALGPLAVAVAGAISGRRPWGVVVLSAVASLARPEAAFAVGMAGMVLVSYGFRRSGVKMTIVGWGIGGSLLVGSFVVFRQAGSSVAVHFSHLGVDTVMAVPFAMWHNPARALSPLIAPFMLLAVAIWLLLYGLLPIVAWRWLLVALPPLAIPVFGSWEAADFPWAHYWLILIPVGAISSVFAFRDREDLQRGAIVVASFSLGIGWIILGGLFGFPPIGLDGNRSAEQAINRILRDRPDQSVGVPARLVGLNAERETVFLSPEPLGCLGRTMVKFEPTYPAPDVLVIDTRLEVAAEDAYASRRDLFYTLMETVSEYEVYGLRPGVDSLNVERVSCRPNSGE